MHVLVIYIILRVKSRLSFLHWVGYLLPHYLYFYFTVTDTIEGHKCRCSDVAIVNYTVLSGSSNIYIYGRSMICLWMNQKIAWKLEKTLYENITIEFQNFHSLNVSVVLSTFSTLQPEVLHIIVFINGCFMFIYVFRFYVNILLVRFSEILFLEF